MRSLESSRHHDLDQVDPEHVNKIGRETSWDDLKDVPFRGESRHSKEEIMQEMDRLAAFGQKVEKKPKEESVEDFEGMSLSDISETF
jgi:hypothetical protein